LSTYSKNPMEKIQFVFDVFLSHSSLDKVVVQELARRLDKNGIKVWFDEWQIQPGNSIPGAIEKGLENSRILIFCMSKNSFGSEWAQLELATFQFRDPLNRERRFIPLRLDDADILPALQQFLYVDWRAPHSPVEYQKLLSACIPQKLSTNGKHLKVKRQFGDGKTDSRIASHILVCIFDNGASTALFSGFGPSVEFWHVKTKKKLPLSIKYRLGFANAIALSDNGVVTGGIDRIIRYWERDTNSSFNVATEYIGAGSEVRCLAIDKNLILAGCEDGSIRIWDRESKDLIRSLKGHNGSVTAVLLSGDRVLTASADTTIRLWNSGNRCLRVFEGHSKAVNSLAINCDQLTVLSSSDDGTIRLWKIATGECLQVFEAHTSLVSCLAWHSSGRLFLSGSADRTIRLWDSATGKCIKVLDGHASDVVGIAWQDETNVVSVDALGFRSWTFLSEDIIPTKTGEPLSERSTDNQIHYTNAKVLVVGESGAGKTALSHRLAGGTTWVPTDSTIGGWATQWKIPMLQNDQIQKEIWLWDFGGQADQRIIHQLYMDETSVAVLVFDGSKQDVFNSLGQWDRDVTRASSQSMVKLLVAGRIDASSVKTSQSQLDAFISERGFSGYLKTSAKTGLGCEELKEKIIASIDWELIPWRSSPTLFKTLKDEIVTLKEQGQVLMRFNDLRDRLKLLLIGNAALFSDDQLRAVISLLAGPGVVAELKFGGWVLFQPELINAHAQAVLQTIREDASEMGCIAEDRVLQGNLIFHTISTISTDDQKFILLAMHQMLVEKGLCRRQPTATGNLLVFPSFYRRQRPIQAGHPTIIVSYTFDGFLDEIYATLVVHLHHTQHFLHDQLWQDAADFRASNGKQIGVKLSSTGEGGGRLEIYCDPTVGVGQKIQFVGYVHAHLNQRARNVKRHRHYTCLHCDEPLADLAAVSNRLSRAMIDIGC
jgi:small GTP-binding protein